MWSSWLAAPVWVHVTRHVVDRSSGYTKAGRRIAGPLSAWLVLPDLSQVTAPRAHVPVRDATLARPPLERHPAVQVLHTHAQRSRHAPRPSAVKIASW